MERHIPHSQGPQSNREKTNTQISLIQSTADEWLSCRSTWDQWEENHVVEQASKSELHACGGVCDRPPQCEDSGAFDKQTETHVLGGVLHDVLVQEELLVML